MFLSTDLTLIPFEYIGLFGHFLQANRTCEITQYIVVITKVMTDSDDIDNYQPHKQLQQLVAELIYEDEEVLFTWIDAIKVQHVFFSYEIV